MTLPELDRLLQQGENTNLEYKASGGSMPQTLFETVAAFLNKEGGTILLGVEDHGIVTGVDPQRLIQLRKDIVTASNNPAVLQPPFTLSVGEVVKAGLTVLYLKVPVSSQVHLHRGVVYDRENDSDFRITDESRIGEIYFRKRQLFSENQIYPYLQVSDLNPEIFRKARAFIRSIRADHPWLETDDLGLLRRAQLHRRDFQTGQEGLTLAAAMLFGTDEVIQSILPAYKLEALVRKVNMDRWDDRLTLRTNLIDSYGLLMEFIRKHLPDKFFLEGDRRRDLRELIFREVVGNVIVHREYTNARPSELVIYADRVEVTNPNRTIFRGPLNPETFSPFAKNPNIRKVFTEFGWTDEIGSGIRNVSKYLPYYAEGAQPQFIEDDIFKTLIPLVSAVLGHRASTLLELLGLTEEQRPLVPLSILEKLSVAPELANIPDEEAFWYWLVPSWAEKGAKLDKLRFLINNNVSYNDFQQVPSWTEKGTKLLPKRSRVLLSILVNVMEPIGMDTLMQRLAYENRKSFRDLYMNPLREEGLLRRTIPDKPNDPHQQYVITEKGRLMLGGFDL